ncbi:MAG: cytochrome B6 [Ilumatobacter coccineus]|uniref:Cytochrome bc1 complex cytochrome b subunit n=1 Tax=Ilumatobacter coccineus TaxID=467094 RepID=A0A2G6KFD4_9ACTN|nr:MAG: cytochrome B6 [Ilumatobacter coccineus]
MANDDQPDRWDRLYDRFRATEFGQAVFRAPRRRTARDRIAGQSSNFLLHLYPARMRRREIEFRHSWYLGVISVVLLVILVVTGVALMFFYVPSTDAAHQMVGELTTEVPFGRFMRNAHRWAGHLMVISVSAHMLRIFYRGAYKKPRQFNWIVGVNLLILTLMLAFTGYLLPWDQLSFWAVTVSTEALDYVPLIGDELKELALGGAEITDATLLRFYVLHVAVLPLIMVGLVMLHLWRWRKDARLPQEFDDDE